MYPSLNIVVTSWSEVTTVEQVRLMARTALLVGFGGSDILSAVFMRKGVVVVFCRMFDSEIQRRSNEYNIWLQHLRYLSVTQFCDENVRFIANNNTKESAHEAVFLNEIDIGALRQVQLT